MKKIVLAIIGFGSILLSTTAKAQSFTPDKDHIKYTVYQSADIHNGIVNNTPSDLTLNWRVLSHDFPTEWKDGTGICDNVTCYVSSVLGPGATPGTTYITAPFSGTMDFKFQINLENAPAGTHSAVIEFSDGTTIDTVTFEINKWPTNINKTQKAENNITLYPNPARSELNVLFDANTGIRNIAVYNVIGKAVNVYRVTGSSARLDIDNIPSGIYFLRFVDSNGRVIATRKFTHQ